MNIDVEILKGNFNRLPKKAPSEIRIFLSSTFKDYQVERNYLIENVFFDLRKKCFENYQKDLTFIDMRWGITDEATNQQLTTQICLNEIEKCQKESIGPSFVVFLSYRYGTRCLKYGIEEEEFNILRDELKLISNEDVVNSLDYCYDLDQNSVKNKEYKLKSLADILSSLKIDKKEWQKKEEILINFIRASADNCLRKEKFTLKQWNYYFTSVTDQEVQMGILNETNANLKTVAFIRDLTNIEENKNSIVLKSFTEDDESMKHLLEELKVHVGRKLSNSNKFYYKLDWSKLNDFKDLDAVELKTYLKNFAQDFESSIISLINKNLDSGGVQSDPEILHHARVCNELTKQFNNRPKLIKKIKKYLNDSTNNKPFVIAGPSGSGKSTLMAYLLNEIKTERPNDFLIIRFMGTSRESSTIKSVMKSLIDQLNKLFNIKEDDFLYESIIELRDRLVASLSNISKRYPNQNIIILLDSIDQLSKRDYCLDWMFYELPKNIKIIYSVLTKYEGIFDKLKEKLDYLKINDLKIDEAKEIYKSLLATSNRTLSEAQWSVVNKLLLNIEKIYPLHIKLLFDVTSKWHSSYIASEEFSKCLTIKDTIKYLFRNLEKLYGERLFTRCIFYLTLFDYRGIAESELEDILSIDDYVLTSVFQYHHPPVRHFPIALWFNIKYELKEYIGNKETDGVSVISWSHRAFIEASQEYCKEMFEYSDLRDNILINIIDYFIEKWNKIKSDGTPGEMKEFEYKKKKLSEFTPKLTGRDTEYISYRNTKSQKIRYENKSEKKIIYNKRKLNELIYVINMLKNSKLKIKMLKEHIYLNYEFMLSKAELREMSFCIDMHEKLCELKSSVTDENDLNELQELIDVSESYVLYFPKIEQSPSESLSTEVVSRLKSRSADVINFAKKSHLMALNSYVEDEIANDIFCVDENSNTFINQYYTINNISYLFVETEKDSITSLNLISLNTRRLLGQLNLRLKADNIQIIILEEVDTIASLSNIDGFVYFTSGNTVYSSNFNSEISVIKKFNAEHENIKELCLLSSSHLIVFLQKSLVFLKLKDIKQETSVYQNIVQNDEIEFIKTNIPVSTVYSAKYLNKTFENVKIVIGLKNKVIKIYQVKKQFLDLCSAINDLSWNYYGYDNWVFNYEKTWRESILIDQSFSIENISKQKSQSIRFAIEKNEVVEVIEVNRDGKYSTIERIDKIKLGRDDSEYDADEDRMVELVHFEENKIIIFYVKKSQSIMVNHQFDIYQYDLESKTYLELSRNFARSIYYVPDDKLLAIYGFRDINFHKIYDFQIKKPLSSVIFAIKNLNHKEVLKIKNQKLLLIEKNRFQLKEVDYAAAKSSILAEDLKVKDIFCQIDTRNILAEIEMNEKSYGVAIIDTVTRKVLLSKEFQNEKKVIGCNKNYFVIDSNKSVEQRCFCIYEILKDNDSYNFVEILKTNVDSRVELWQWQTYRCLLDESNDKIYILLYNKAADYFELRVISNESGNAKCDLFIFNMDNIDLTRGEMRTIITRSNKYICLWEKSNDNILQIYYIDAINNKLLVKTILNESFEENNIDKYVDLECIPNSDDLIIQFYKTIYQIHYDDKINNFSVLKLKEMKTEKFTMRMNEQCFIIEYDHTYKKGCEIYTIDDLVENKTNVKALILNKGISCLSNTIENYLIFLTRDEKLYFYKLDKNNIVFIACLDFNNFVNVISASEKYISLVFKSTKLLTFEIFHD